MSSSRKVSRNPEEMLPKMIVCGTEKEMPKLILCEDKEPKRKACGASCSQNEEEEEPLSSKFARQLKEMQRRMVAPSTNGQLEADLAYKQRTIEELQRRLCCVQCEMSKLLQENTLLNSRVQQAYMEEASKCIPSSNNFSQIENRLSQYHENTKMLEKQLNSMESNVKTMKEQLMMAKRGSPDKEQKSPFAASTECPSKSARAKSGCCRTQQCSLRKSASDQHLLDLKEQYCQLQNSFKIEADSIVKKINKNLSSFIQ